MKKYIFISFLLIVGLLFTACSSSDLSDGTNDGTDGTGNFALFLADKPVNNVDKVLVTISEVQIIRSDTGIETINDFSDNGGEMQFDLLDLRFNETLLGQQLLPAGVYEQIRLIVAAEEQGNGIDNNSQKSKVIYKDGTEDTLFIPSGNQTGLKINHEFTIEDGVVTRLILDADVSKIMHSTGNSNNNGDIVLRPTAIKVIDKVISGNIEGIVLDTNGNNIYDSLEENYDVMVEAIQNSETKQSTVVIAENYSKDTDGDGIVDIEKPAGSFFLRGLSKGTYSLRAYIVDADGNEDTNTYKATTIENIVLDAGETYTLPETIKLEKSVL